MFVSDIISAPLPHEVDLVLIAVRANDVLRVLDGAALEVTRDT
jgi:hypothetical protein